MKEPVKPPESGDIYRTSCGDLILVYTDRNEIGSGAKLKNIILHSPVGTQARSGGIDGGDLVQWITRPSNGFKFICNLPDVLSKLNLND